GGAGDGPDARSFDVAMPDFTDAAVQARLTDERALAVIRRGGQANGLNYAMPPWEGVLSEPEMRAMVAHLRRLGE
ncbi:MAG: hypothetical protein H7X93_13360, partial [Sphingomonadaceae bacterium]|nr:hypothetical protein [Sphingomonadaceae bacterium]